MSIENFMMEIFFIGLGPVFHVINNYFMGYLENLDFPQTLRTNICFFKRKIQSE